MIEKVDFTGRLNKDDEVLPVGDYHDAKNVTILQPSKSGGAGSIKKIESVEDTYGSDLTGDLTSPSIIAEESDTNGNIFILVADSDDATIWKIEPDETTTQILKYNHGSASVSEPDFKIIDDIIVWNYYGDGVPLSWLTTRTATTITDDRDILFIKAPPVYTPTVTKVRGIYSFPDIEKRQFQFACRYIYDTGDVSVLSPFSSLYGAEKDVSSYIIQLDSSESTPNYVTKVEYLVREGNTGSWKRFDTRDITALDDDAPFYYITGDDSTSDWFTFSTYDGSFMSFNQGQDYVFQINDNTRATAADGLQRNLGNLDAGDYNLKISTGAFTNDSQSSGDPYIRVSVIDTITEAEIEGVDLDYTDENSVSVLSFNIASTGPTSLKVLYSSTSGAFDLEWNIESLIVYPDPLPETPYGFYGQAFETLASIDVNRQFDFVPYTTESIEVQGNRVFLVANEDIKTGDEDTVSISVEESADDFESGGSYRYNKLEEANTAQYSAPLVAGFANNSRYGWGVVFYDDYLRTRGLEASVGWRSPEFSVGAADVTITKNSTLPTWAKYYQVVRTKNLDKDFVYEGFPTGVYFMVESESGDASTTVQRVVPLSGFSSSEVTDAPKSGTESSSQYQGDSREDYDNQAQVEFENNSNANEIASSIAAQNAVESSSVTLAGGKLVPFLPYLDEDAVGLDELANEIKYFVVDINGMFQAGRPYNYNKGDLITGYFEGQDLLNKTSVRTVTLEIEYQEGHLLYCDPNPITSKNTSSAYGWPQIINADYSQSMWFEIYSPSQTNNDVYYAVSDVHPISELTGLADGGTEVKTIEGDTHWSEVSINTTSNGPYEKGFGKFSADTALTIKVGDASSVSSELGVRVNKFNINTTNHNYSNNKDLTLDDGLININTTGSYRTKFSVTFNPTTAGNFTADTTYATFELRTAADQTVLARGVFNYSSTGSQTVEITSTFGASNGDSLGLYITSYVYNSGSDDNEDIDFTLDYISIGLAENLVGDFAFSLRKRKLDNSQFNSVIFKSTSPDGNLLSWHTDIGKPYTLISDKSNNGLGRRIRFGGRKLVNSNYSRLHSFMSLDRKDLGNEFGDITALIATTEEASDGGVILAICKNKTASIYTGVRVVQDGQGGTQLVQSNDVVASVRPLMGDFGTQHKRSIATLRGRVCWWDENNKCVVRYTREGLFPVSNYKMKSYFQEKSGQCVGFVDPFYGYYHIAFDSDDYSCAFDFNDRWVSFYDLQPDCRGTHFDQFMYLASGTQLYRSLGSTYNTFFASSGDSPYIQMAKNFEIPVELTGLSLSADNYIDNSTVNGVKAGVLDVRIDNNASGGQYTTMDDAYFEYQDGNIYSHVYRDENVDQYTGPPLIGSLNKIKLTLSDDTVQDNIRQVLLGIEKSYGHTM